MAVEAHHQHFFSPQLMITNREMIHSIYETNVNNLYNTQMGVGISGGGGGSSGGGQFPFNGGQILGTMTQNPAESGLTCNLSGPRKRMRLVSNQSYQMPSNIMEKPRNHIAHDFSFLGEDLSFQLQQQHLEIDRLVSQHMEKVRREVMERRKRHARAVVVAVEEAMMKRLKAKEEEMERMGKLNWALEERVKSLSIENQIWRDLAQTSEATANELRSNLENVLAHVRNDQSSCQVADDAESCCGSSGGDEQRMLAEAADDDDDEATTNALKRNINNNNSNYYHNNKNVKKIKSDFHLNRSCRGCGKAEASVLLLPCRHLCVCGVCGSNVQMCPVCNCMKNGCLHVNMS